MVRPYPFKFFKDCFPKVLLSPFFRLEIRDRLQILFLMLSELLSELITQLLFPLKSSGNLKFSLENLTFSKYFWENLFNSLKFAKY